MPPWTRGWSVFTRPPRISGACVKSPTETTGTPASASAFCVPPGARSSTPGAARGSASALQDVSGAARRRDPRLVLRDRAQLEESPGLDLADPLAGEVHDRPHLLERDAALVGDVERAGLVELPDLPVREVQLDGPGGRVHVQVEV